MEPALLGGMLALGLASGVHCVGMCGGIVTAFSTVQFNPRPQWMRQLLFNAGRISSYGIAGAIAGTLGYATGAVQAQSALAVLANVVLILVGLHLAGVGAMLRLERLGAPLWRRLQPYAARASSAGNPYVAGLLWGWLPCGLVYGALAVAVFSRSSLEAAAAMLAFGLGTLPWLLAAGTAAARLRGWMGRRAVRLAAGGAVLAFGVYGLAHAGADYLCR
jgi:hypothetical protein